MHRFFISHSGLSTLDSGRFSSSDPELCHQLGKVLKMRAGEKITLLDNSEHEFIARLSTLDKKLIQGEIIEKRDKPDVSSTRAIHLFVPPLKNPSRWEWMVEKCTEIGVASFTPLITARTEVKELRKIERLNKIIQEAAEQSGRTKLPLIHEPISFQDAVKKFPKSTNLIATLTPDSKPISSYNLKPNTYNLYLGPVGDFSPEEIQLALEHKFYPVTLGSQTLRTETAAIVASTVLLQEFGL